MKLNNRSLKKSKEKLKFFMKLMKMRPQRINVYIAKAV